MAKLSAEQARTRDRVETVIRLVAPALNLVLAAGERLSRVVEPDDPEYYPARVEDKGVQQPVADVTGGRGARQE